MAEIPMQGQGGAQRSAGQLGTLTNYAGAVASIALMVGIGVWGYKVLSADVSGVPVVMAASDGPMRVAPEDPGGANAAHQGLSVNKVMAEGAAEKPADRLVLAPKPVQLTDEDQPSEAAYAPTKTVRPAPQPVIVNEPAAEEVLTPQMASIRALAEQLADGVAPLSKPAPKTPAEAAPVQVAAVAAPKPSAIPPEPAASSAQAAVAKSLRPKLRPSALISASAPSASAAAAPAPEPAALSIPAGTRLVQLGAFDAPDVAKREWERLSARFGDYMDGKTQVVQRAKSGGRVFYRLRAMGFADLSDARRFCAALVAEKADCIPVVAK